MNHLIELTGLERTFGVAVYVRTEREKDLVSQNDKLRQRKISCCVLPLIWPRIKSILSTL